MRSSRYFVLAAFLSSTALAACDRSTTEPGTAPEAAPRALTTGVVCKTDERNAPNVTIYHNDVNHDLSDYGVIFEEAAGTTCVDYAATALYKKVKATLDAPAQWDGVVQRTVGPYQGWLQGANVSLIYATALRLGAKGKLSKPLDELLGRIVYVENLDAGCGFDNGKWVAQNSCMDDYAVAASGWGWRAAYAAKRGRSAYTDATNARNAIHWALNEDKSICIYVWAYPSLYSPIPPRGPCIGMVGDLLMLNASALALHGGDAMPYGIGLVTSIASAAVALSQTQYPMQLDSDERYILSYLRDNSRVHTDPSGSHFLSNCYRFQNVNGTLVATTDYECREPNYGTYRPKMFPVSAFYNKYVGTELNQYNFSQWDPTLFCDNWAAMSSCGFWSPGRRVIYKTLAYDWTLATPPLSGTLGDYGTTFRTSGARYLSAANGGGAAMNAVPTAAGVNEKFSMVDLNGGNLMSGDRVQLQSKSGHWVVAEDGGNYVVNVNRPQPHEYETFTLVKASGATGQIYTGEAVALRTYNSYYVVAENGGGGQVNANRLAVGPWETFTISFARNF